MINRRHFLSGALKATGYTGLLCGIGSARAQTGVSFLDRNSIGKVKPRMGTEIAASPLGVGFETLDRKMFLPGRTYDALSRLGVKWARVQTGWCRCETVKGEYDFAWLDEVVDSLIRIGVQPWFNVGYGNKLYTPEAPESTAVGWIPENSDEARQGWVNFVRALARHYKGRVQHYEIWNEPNIMPFWRPGKPTPEGYVAFIRRTSMTLRAELSDCILAGGCFGGFPTEFLKESLELGLAKHVDKITYHPYALIPERKYAESVALWRDLLAQYKPTPVLWQGECGCPSTATSTGALSRHKWTEDRQARWLLRRIINDLRLKLEMVSWYHMCDQAGYRLVGYPEGKSGAYFGLLRMDDYTPKPSYFAYQNLCSLFDAQTQPSDSATLSFSGGSAAGVGAANVIDQAIFTRRSLPLCAYWRPVNVHLDSPPQSIDVIICLKNGILLDNPVLIDTLSGKGFKLDGVRQADSWSFSGLPLTDYPLVIADAKAFELTGS
ncbi:MAG: beta-galactosidase [Kiritimatiellae bacterium]|jgi:hypothetical protein|nr:beta-galactosidase [Kiritimatiellia bacterium]